MGGNTPSRATRSGLDWLVDFAVEKWPYILAAVGGTVMTVLAAVTKWLAVYGPVAWGAIGIASFLILAGGLRVIATAQQILAHNRFAKKREQTTGINPLDDHFSRQRINLADFFHPFYKPTRLAKFQDCEVFGPAVIIIMSGTLDGCTFNGCEAVIVKRQVMVIGAIAFEKCTFERCAFYRVTFLLVKELYLHMMEQSRGDRMPVISDGTAGNL